MTQATIARRAPKHEHARALEHESHVAPTTPRARRGAQKQKRTEPAEKHPGFTGGHIQMPTWRLVHFWSSLLCGAVRPYDARTFLACLEVVEERKFAPRGCKPVYLLSELVTLVGGGGERPIRASLRRLHRAGVLTWRGSDGPRLHDSKEMLADAALPHVSKMEALMPEKREFFPLPRALSKSVLMGGVKRSVLASVFAHLLRCPHLKPEGWDPVGAVKANWIEAAFGISERSAVRARSHLVNELGWLTPVAAQVWRQKANGGYFAVNLEWSKETPGELKQTSAPGLSTGVLSGQNRPGDARLTELESEQTSPSEIQVSDLGGFAPEPPVEFRKKTQEGRTEPKCVTKPRLTKLVDADLPDVSRVMELFEQALESPVWRTKGWTPSDTYVERLNWAAAARRAHVRGSTNPCGVFIHLVSNRKWSHVSHEDEEAVRRDLARWTNPEPETPEHERGMAPQLRQSTSLSEDGAVMRRIENAVIDSGMLVSREELDGELRLRGWSTERIGDARAALQSWKCANSQRTELEA